MIRISKDTSSRNQIKTHPTIDCNCPSMISLLLDILLNAWTIEEYW